MSARPDAVGVRLEDARPAGSAGPGGRASRRSGPPRRRRGPSRRRIDDAGRGPVPSPSGWTWTLAEERVRRRSRSPRRWRCRPPGRAGRRGRPSSRARRASDARSASPTSQRICGNAARNVVAVDRDPAAPGPGALDDLDAAILGGRPGCPGASAVSRTCTSSVSAIDGSASRSARSSARPGSRTHASSPIRAAPAWPSRRSVAT